MKYFFYFSFTLLLQSCTSFDSKEWLRKDKIYDRVEQIEVLCNKTLYGDEKRENIISVLGEPDIKCDTTNKMYGTAFTNFPPYDKFDGKFINNKEKYNLVIKIKCSESFMIERYVVGFNGSGPDFMLLCYDKDNRLKNIFLKQHFNSLF